MRPQVFVLRLGTTEAEGQQRGLSGPVLIWGEGSPTTHPAQCRTKAKSISNIFLALRTEAHTWASGQGPPGGSCDLKRSPVGTPPLKRGTYVLNPAGCDEAESRTLPQMATRAAQGGGG